MYCIFIDHVHCGHSFLPLHCQIVSLGNLHISFRLVLNVHF